MPDPTAPLRAIAFDGTRCLADGLLADVARLTREAVVAGAQSVLVFDADTSHPIEIDFRGSADHVQRQVLALSGASAPPSPTPPLARGPGRPRLGVVAREVTLLPRHWAWLAEQPASASVTLRRLVEAARRGDDVVHRRRTARESTYRFILALAGDLPGFEEATRGLFAGDRGGFTGHVTGWPEDVRTHAMRLAEASFDEPAPSVQPSSPSQHQT